MTSFGSVARIHSLYLLVVVALCSTASPASSPPLASIRRGLDTAGMDRAVAPGSDFFAYANGTWLKHTAIPADRAAYGTGAIVTELTERRTVGLIQDAAKARAGAGPDVRKVGDFYASFMDESAVERAGVRPLQPTLDRIAAIGNRDDLARFLGSTLRADVDVLNSTNLYTDNIFGLWVAQDLDDPTRYSPFLLQGGLGMPDREYYLDPSPRMTEIRAKYRAHIAGVLELAHVSDDDARATRVLELERRIAEVHWSREDAGDVLKGNNHWVREDFGVRAPGLDWDAYFVGAGLEDAPDFVVWQPSAFSGISALTASVPLDTWKDYLAYHAVEHFAGYLPKAFVSESFAFNGKVIQGVDRLRDRWKRGVDATSAALGEAVGKLYVERYFSAAEKARAQAMVANIVAAFAERIDRLPWMAPETKVKAKAKLAVLKVGVGYPDRWRDYSGLEIRRDDLFGNAQRAELFEYRRNLRKLGEPVDRSEWVMTPQLVNAVNLPAMNAMNFPAAILQPPYFDPSRPAAMDYGAIGAIIGHEISHSFDDQGSLFDADGRLNNWWTPADFDHFKAAAEALVKQYDSYRPFPDLHVNGKQTLGENIADVAGLSAALDAYRLSLHGKPAPTVAGMSGDQQFFVSFAQSWRGKAREPALRQQIVVDGHAPGEYRTFTVRNLDAWYDSFPVKPGETLYLAPKDRVRIW
jgi:putative endopeptidase